VEKVDMAEGDSLEEPFIGQSME